jgi:hypothetical protein
MSVNGDKAIARMLEYGPKVTRVFSMGGQMMKSLIYAYAPHTHHGYRKVSDLWDGALTKHVAAVDPGMEPPAGMIVVFCNDVERIPLIVGISLGHNSFAYWDDRRERVISLGIDAYLSERPQMRLLGWTEYAFGERIVPDADADPDVEEIEDEDVIDLQTLAGEPIDAIPTDLREDDDADDEEPEEDAPIVGSITGTIVLADGSKREFSIADIGWQQWGATREELGRSVDVLEAMTSALKDEGLL